MIWEWLLKTFIPVLRILIIKTTFSYFPGIFENPAPVVKTSYKRNINLKKQYQKYFEISNKNECVEKKSMIIGCNIWMICLELNWFFYNPSRILQLSSVWVVFNNFLLLDTTDRNKISSNHNRIFFDVSLYPLVFFVNSPFRNDIFMNCSLKPNIISWLI